MHAAINELIYSSMTIIFQSFSGEKNSNNFFLQMRV